MVQSLVRASHERLGIGSRDALHGPRGAAVRLGPRLDGGLAFSIHRADPELRIREPEPDRNGAYEEFFDYTPPRDFRIEELLAPACTSRSTLRIARNNTVHARYFQPARDSSAGRKQCRAAPLERQPAAARCSLRRDRKVGISALRISLPYHDHRIAAGADARPIMRFQPTSAARSTPHVRP